MGIRRYPEFAKLLCSAMLAMLGGFINCSAQSLNPYIRISQYSHTAWRLQDGLLPSLPQTMQQTTDGYIWIGTLDGLLRFDGVRFIRWKPAEGPSLPENRIMSLKADKDGSLWVGTPYGLAHLVNGVLTNYSENPGAIEQILIDRKGVVWFTRAHIAHTDIAGPLCQVQGLHIKCFGAQDGLPFRYAQSLAEDTEGFLWVGTDVSVARWKPGLTTTYAPAGLKAAAGQAGIEALWPGKNGSMWVGITRPGSGLGLQHVVDQRWQSIQAPGFDSRDLKVWAIYVDAQNSLWIGTTDRGLYRVHDGTVEHFGASDGLSSDSPSTIFEDREGDLWVITSEGLDRFRELPLSSYSMRQGLSAPLAVSVYAANDGAVWIANNGAIDILKDGTISSLGHAKGLPGQIVESVFQDHVGRLWAGVDDKLVVYNEGRFVTVTLPDKRQLGTVHSITEDTNGDLWAMTETGQESSLFQVHGLTAKKQTLPRAFSDLWSVTADGHGGVWLGSLRGELADYRNGKTEMYDQPHLTSKKLNPLRALITYPDGSLLGANQKGLIEWRNGEVRPLTIQNGLPCSYIGSFIKDEKQNLYLNMPCGIVVISREELDRWWSNPGTQIKFRTYGPGDGARFDRSANNSLSAARSKDGRLWFASVNVVQMIDPEHLRSNTVIPPVSIEGLEDNGNSISVREGVQLPPNPHSIEFDYTALSFVAPQKVLFRYRLEGHDTDWQDAGTRRQALYNDLSPGSYRFRVIASNNDGVWNTQGAAVSFSVQPAIYQRGSFKICMVALGCMALWLLYGLRITIVTEQIQALFTERIVERERIARDLHDTLLQGFQGVLRRIQTISKRFPMNSDAQHELEDTIARADSVLAEARDKVLQIRTSSRPQDDIARFVSSRADDLKKIWTCDFSLTVVGTTRHLLPGAFEEIAAISQEALANAFRHADARLIEVELRFGRSAFEVHLSDDGKGLPESALQRRGDATHWGILGMQERAEKLHARLVFNRRVRGGTEVHLSVPASVCYQRSIPTWMRRFRGRSV